MQRLGMVISRIRIGMEDSVFESQPPNEEKEAQQHHAAQERVD
jgi:hypothetical protein